jgi:hypothetical protein
MMLLLSSKGKPFDARILASKLSGDIAIAKEMKINIWTAHPQTFEIGELAK